MKLAERIKQQQFASPEQESMLSVIVTSSWILNELTSAMAPHGITPSQYNVLRILRGSHPTKLTCSEIGQRLLERTPDVTRLLNRLERNHLISRRRARHDRRVVEVGITERGLSLLEQMQADVDGVQQRLTQHLSAAEHRQLSNMLERLRAGH
jgi:DNA-binding MarR family transcriptional regulator